MSSVITITVDEKGNSTIGELPPGVFCSRFAAPPDAGIKDVISINAAGTYTLQIDGPSVENPVATPPVEILGLQKSQAAFFVDASILPVLQQYGTAGCQIGGIEYTLGVIVNPSVVLIPATVGQSGAVLVNQSTMPKGVHFKNAEDFAVWTAGGFTFAFSLMPSQGMQFQEVIFTKPAPMVSSEISADGLTAWIYNDYLATSPGVVVSFELYCSTPMDEILHKIIDPTIINNPINQGGDGGVLEPDQRPEMAGVLADRS